MAQSQVAEAGLSSEVEAVVSQAEEVVQLQAEGEVKPQAEEVVQLQAAEAAQLREVGEVLTTALKVAWMLPRVGQSHPKRPGATALALPEHQPQRRRGVWPHSAHPLHPQRKHPRSHQRRAS